MEPKVTTVTLTTASGRNQSFEIAHAERLLKAGFERSGWKLPEDSKYEYHNEYGLRIKADTGRASKANKKAGHSKGRSAAATSSVPHRD